MIVVNIELDKMWKAVMAYFKIRRLLAVPVVAAHGLSAVHCHGVG